MKTEAIHLLNVIQEARPALESITEDDASSKPIVGKWSLKEILGHLIDSAANNHQRFVRAQFTDDLVFPGYDQDQWISAQKYSEEPWSNVIQLWSAYNLHLVHVASLIPEEALTKSRSSHTLDEIAFKLELVDNEPATLENLIRDYLVHLKHHLDQIFDEVNNTE